MRGRRINTSYIPWHKAHLLHVHDTRANFLFLSIPTLTGSNWSHERDERACAREARDVRREERETQRDERERAALGREQARNEVVKVAVVAL